MKRLIGIPLSIAAASTIAMAAGSFTLNFTSSSSDTWQLVGADQGMDISALVGTAASPGSAASVIQSAWYYDDVTGAWKVAANTFNPAQVGYTLLTATNPYEGVWMRIKGGSAASATVSTTTDGTQASFAVTQGWNLRGVGESVSTTSASQLIKYPFLNDKTNGILIYTYNIATNAFEVYSPNGFVSTFTGTQFSTINAYEGFWIRVDNTKTYTISDAAASVTASLPVTDGIIGDPGSLIDAATLADNTLNNFSTLLKFGPNARLASTSLTSFSGTASTATSDLNTTLRSASSQMLTTRDALSLARNSVDTLNAKLSGTGFVSVNSISGPIARIKALVNDLNSSIQAVAGTNRPGDYNLTETNSSSDLGTSGTASQIGMGKYLTFHPLKSDVNTTRLDPILLAATQGRDKSSSLSTYVQALSANFTELNTTMKDFNTSVWQAANGSDTNATIGIVAADVNASAEVLKVVTATMQDINGSHTLILTYNPQVGTPVVATIDLNSSSDPAVASTLNTVTFPIQSEDNLSVFNAIKNAIALDATMSAALTTGTPNTAIPNPEMNITGITGVGNFGLTLGHSSTVSPNISEANITETRAYAAAVTGVSQTSSVTFDGVFTGGTQIDFNLSAVEDQTDVHYTGSLMDTNVTLVLTADKTGAEVAALLSTEIDKDTSAHGWGDTAINSTSGSKSVSTNGTSGTLTLEANSSFAGTSYTLLVTVDGNILINALATQSDITGPLIYDAVNNYASLTAASGAQSVLNWEANASNFHQAVESYRFATLSVDGTVYTDSGSRLVWDVEEKTSTSACGASNRFNINNWALPTIPELITLYDASTDAMSLTWLNALDFSNAPFTVTPSTGLNLNKVFFVSSDGNASATTITVETERRVLSASGMTIREYNSTDTSVHMSPHCVAQQTSTTDFDEYYNTSRFGAGNTLTNIATTALASLSDADKKVTDSALNIEWERKITVTSSTAPYSDYANAEYYCAVLNHGGKTDWRLPTIEELTSLNLFDIEARYNLTQASTGLNRATLFLYDFNDSSNYWSTDSVDVNGTAYYKVLNPISDVNSTNMFSTTAPATGATDTRAICVRNQ